MRNPQKFPPCVRPEDVLMLCVKIPNRGELHTQRPPYKKSRIGKICTLSIPPVQKSGIRKNGHPPASPLSELAESATPDTPLDPLSPPSGFP